MNKIWDFLVEIADSFRDWIIDNQANPLLWIGLFLLGLLIFFATYNALQKEK